MGLNEVNLSNIKGVLLDIDDTLYCYSYCHQIALTECFGFLVGKYKELDLVTCQKIYQSGRKKCHITLPGRAASHSRLLYFQYMVEQLLEHTDVNLILHLEALYWDTFLSKMELDKNIQVFIDKCFQKKIPICLLTDLTANIQFRKVNQLKIADKIKYIVTSEEAGIEKPHPFMFLKALNKLQIKPREALMIGDNQAKDLKGAALLNIQHIEYKAKVIDTI